jgi:hypothetical protein
MYVRVGSNDMIVRGSIQRAVRARFRASPLFLLNFTHGTHTSPQPPPPTPPKPPPMSLLLPPPKPPAKDLAAEGDAKPTLFGLANCVSLGLEERRRRRRKRRAFLAY